MESKYKNTHLLYYEIYTGVDFTGQQNSK